METLFEVWGYWVLGLIVKKALIAAKNGGRNLFYKYEMYVERSALYSSATCVWLR